MIINRKNDYTNHFIVTEYRTDIDGVVLESNMIFKTNGNINTSDIINLIKNRKSKVASPHFEEFDKEPFEDCVVRLDYKENGKDYSNYYCMDVVVNTDKIIPLNKYDRDTFVAVVKKFYPYRLKNALILNTNDRVEPEIELFRHESTYIIDEKGTHLTNETRNHLKASSKPAVIVDALYNDIKELFHIAGDAHVQMVPHSDEGPNLEIFWNSHNDEGNCIGHKVSYSFKYLSFDGEREIDYTLSELSDHDYDTLQAMFDYIKSMYCRRPLLDKLC